MIDVDKTAVLRSKQRVAIGLTLVGAGGVVANLADVTWIATAILTIMTILGSCAWASYAADMYRRKPIPLQRNHQPRSRPPS